MNQLIGLLTICLLGLAVAVPSLAGEAAKPVFKADGASIGLSLGLDNKVYVNCGNMIVQCNRDGSQAVGMPMMNTSVSGVAASTDGIVAVAYSHFAKNVTLFDRDFNVVNRFTNIADAGFRSPGGIATGPSGDFYALDQGLDQVVRFHPDGIRCGIYRIPREPNGPNGEIAHFRLCEKTKTIYVVNKAALIRCFSFDSPEWKSTCRKLWEVKISGSLEGGNVDLFYGYGGYDVDENGILYVMEKADLILKRYDPAGKQMKDVTIQFSEELKPAGEKYLWGIRVSGDELFLHRSHPTEMYQRYSLATGLKMSVVAVPQDFPAIVKVPKSTDDGQLIKPVESNVGMPAGRGKPLRVLFIGNSQFRCVSDIPEIIEEMSRSATDKKVPLILAEEVVIGGVGLEGYWKDGLPRKRIAAGGWDWVVIHEIVYSYGAKFKEYAPKFADEAKKAGAKIMFVATGEVETAKTKADVMYKDAAAMAKEAGGRVAGAGMAWQKAWAANPKLDFYFTDRAHPSAKGYYINACVIFAALTDCNPAGLAIYSEGIDKTPITGEEGALLQKAAWEQYSEDRANEK